jgi:3-deoxy-D-manno-octulosonic-acid transferase
MLFSPKARLWVRGRKGWKQQVTKVSTSNDRWVWVHCSSYGEYEDVATVANLVRKKLPDSSLLLTFFSPSGMEKWKNKNVADHVMYLPVDSSRNARFLLDTFAPELVLFSRSELWPFFLKELHSRTIPTVLVGLLLNSQSSFLKWPQKQIYSKALTAFTKIYCQNKGTQQILKESFQLHSGIVSGNCRIDRIINSLDTIELNLNDWTKGHFCIVAGSTDVQEDQFLSKCIQENVFPNVRWIIVPHEYNEKRHPREYFQSNHAALLYSQKEYLNDQHRVLVVDQVGILKHLYQFADAAVIGGGFIRKGIHSIIEPAFYGVPSLIGPNDRSYPEAQELLSAGYCTKFTDYESFLEQLRKLVLAETSEKSNIKSLVESKRGASEFVVNDLQELLPQLHWVK